MAEKRDRSKHCEIRCSEPWFDWKWMRFPGSFMDKERFDMELDAEFETDGDLIKPIPQLVCDFNFEARKALVKDTTIDTKLLLNAQKRMVAMMAQVAMKNDRLSRIMFWLTVLIAFLTIVQVLPMGVNLIRKLLN